MCLSPAAFSALGAAGARIGQASLACFPCPGGWGPWMRNREPEKSSRGAGESKGEATSRKLQLLTIRASCSRLDEAGLVTRQSSNSLVARLRLRTSTCACALWCRPRRLTCTRALRSNFFISLRDGTDLGSSRSSTVPSSSQSASTRTESTTTLDGGHPDKDASVDVVPSVAASMDVNVNTTHPM